MKHTAILSKMYSLYTNPITYGISAQDEKLDLTSLVGERLKLKYSGKIHCIHCGATTKKSYAQGHCYPCSIKLASCDMCILKPETCHYAKGTCREPKWGEENCFKPHILYLANSSGLKVGITRKSQIPTRWIDQGATQALPVLEVKDRFTSGKIEVLFKKHISDKTDWRKMLKEEATPLNLVEWRDKLLQELSEELKSFEYKLLNDEIYTFKFPVTQYLEKITSFNLDKDTEIEGHLLGIKGQYLIFDCGVLNVRSFSGYEISLELLNANE